MNYIGLDIGAITTVAVLTPLRVSSKPHSTL